MKLEFTVPGEPVAKGRPRLGKFGAFTPKKTVTAEGEVKLFASQAMGSADLFAGPLRLEIECVFQWPASWSNRKKEANKWKVSRPDLDNTMKLYCDAMNGIVFKDDSQVVEAIARKAYGEKPHVRVVVMALS